MTDENQIEDQDIELHDDENEIVEKMAHDPKNAEDQSVKSVDDAENAGGSAPLPTSPGATAKHNTKKDPMPKTKAGMINAMMHKMQDKGTTKKSLQAMYGSVMHKNSVDPDEFEGDYLPETQDINVEFDFSQDLNALVESEATLSDDFKAKAETIFEAAIKSKLSEEIDRLEEKYNEELAEEIESTKAGIVDKIDNYLNYVVENWMEENKLAIQSGLRTEIAENFMNKLKDVFTESYIEVPESKVDLVDDLAGEVEELETALNDQTARNLAMNEELEGYKKDAVIREASKDLADTQIEKLKGLVENVDFEDEETFAEKVATIKESYFNKAKTNSADFDTEEESDSVVETSDSMAQYLNALKQTSKK